MGISNNGGFFTWGQITAKFVTIANTNRDLTGINVEYTNVGNSNFTTYIVFKELSLVFIEFLQVMNYLIKMNHKNLKMIMLVVL